MSTTCHATTKQEDVIKEEDSVEIEEDSPKNWSELLSEPKFRNQSSLQPTLEALQNLQDSLKCAYCEKLFQAPVIAIEPCHHCFCSKCFTDAWANATQDNSHMTCGVCNVTVQGNLQTCRRNEGLENSLEMYRAVHPVLLKSLEELVVTSPTPASSPVGTNGAGANAVGASAALGAASKKKKKQPPPPNEEQQPVSSAQKSTWEYYFQQLVAFKNKHGHTRVRFKNSDDLEFKKFADWVRNQRYLLAKRLAEEGPAKMAPIYHDRIDRLNSIGFDWAAPSGGEAPAQPEPVSRVGNNSKFQAKWEAMYDELKQFHSQYGHSNVERYSDEHKKLHDWARNQKYMLGKKMREGRLSPTSAQRVEKLDTLNFSWRSSSGHTTIDTTSLTPAKKPKLTKLAAKQWGKTSSTNDAALAATLGKVLGALDNLGALHHLEGAVPVPPTAASSSEAATAQGQKRPAPSDSTAVTPANKKRAKLERKLEMLANQLRDAEQNVVRFQTVQDPTMAEQAKARMVDLYNKKVEVEQSMLTVSDGDDQKDSEFMTIRQQRAQLEYKLELVTKHLAEAETNVSRFQGIHDDAMIVRAKSRMAELYKQKVEIENHLMEMDDDDDEEGDDDGKKHVHV